MKASVRLNQARQIVNVIQHTRSCSSYWAAICFYFRASQPIFVRGPPCLFR